MTLNFELDLSRVVSDIITDDTFASTSRSCRELLTGALSDLINICNRSETRNIRVIRYALELFADVHKVLMDKFDGLDLSMYKRILFFMLAVNNENASKDFDVKEHLLHPDESAFYMAFHLEERSGNRDQNTIRPLNKFVSKYFVNSSDFYYCLPIVTFITGGYLDKQALVADIQRHIDQTPAGRKNRERDITQLLLQEPWELDDDTFNHAFYTIVSRAETGELPLTNYPLMFSQLASFVLNDAIDYEMQTLHDKFSYGARLAKEHASYDSDIDRLSIQLPTFIGDGQQAQNDIISLVRDLNDELLREEITRSAQSLFELMRSNFHSFCLQLYGNNEYRLTPLLHEFDARLFSETVLSQPNNEVISLRNALTERYRSSNIGDFLRGEWTIFESLNTQIQLVREAQPKTFRSYVLNVLSKTLTEIVAKLNPVAELQSQE